MTKKREKLEGRNGTQLDAVDFEPYLNETFEITSEVLGTRAMELVSVETSRHRNPVRGRPGFSMLFWEAGATQHAQERATLSHPECGTLEFLIVPIHPMDAGREGPGACYQIIIN